MNSKRTCRRGPTSHRRAPERIDCVVEPSRRKLLLSAPIPLRRVADGHVVVVRGDRLSDKKGRNRHEHQDAELQVFPMDER